MKTQKNLFLLVCSLTSKEKADFTRATSSGGKKFEYVKLYRAIEEISRKKKAYDETELKKKYNNLAVAKADLYEKILSVLRSQRQYKGAEKPKEFQVRSLLEDAWLLKEKKLFAQSKKRLEKAANDAEKYDLHEVLLEILKAKRTLLMAENPKDLKDQVNAIHAEIEFVTATIQNKNEMLMLHDEFFVHVRKHKELNGNFDAEALEKLIKRPELQSIIACISIEAQSNYHFCHAMYHHLKGDAANAWIHARAQYLLWQQHKYMQRIRPLEYRNMLQNYLSLSSAASNFKDYDAALQQMNNGKPKSEGEKASVLSNSINVGLQRALNECNWEAAARAQAEFNLKKDDFVAWAGGSRMQTFYLSFSMLGMVQGEWEAAKGWAEEVLRVTSLKMDQGLAFAAHLQIAISLYMQKSEDETEKKCRYILDNFTREGLQNKFERSIVNIMKRCPQQEQSGNLVRNFEKILGEIKAAGKHKQMKNSIVYAWVRALVSGKAVAEILEND